MSPESASVIESELLSGIQPVVYPGTSQLSLGQNCPWSQQHSALFWIKTQPDARLPYPGTVFHRL